MKSKGKQLKHVKRNKSNKRHFLYSKIFLIFAIALFALFLVLAFIEFVDFSKFNFLQGHEEQSFLIRDECSVLKGMGLVHQIRDVDDCSIRCTNQCHVNNLEKIKSEFSQIENDCNICNCYCE